MAFTGSFPNGSDQFSSLGLDIDLAHGVGQSDPDAPSNLAGDADGVAAHPRSSSVTWNATFPPSESPYLPLRHLWIVYPGPERYRLDKTVSVLPVADIADVPIVPGGSASATEEGEP